MMLVSRTRLEDLAHELAVLSDENSARADRLIDRMRRERQAAAELAKRKSMLLRSIGGRRNTEDFEP